MNKLELIIATWDYHRVRASSGMSVALATTLLGFG